MLSKIIDLIVPSSCQVCGREGELVCGGCREEHLTGRTPSCFRCNKISRAGRTCASCRSATKLSGAIVAYRFDGAVKELVYRLKYLSDRAVARFLAREMAAIVDKSQFDLVSFVPSDGAALRQRGYNQAQLIARELARQIEMPCEGVLLRVKHSSQTKLGRHERLAAVRGNFVVLPKPIENQRLLVVDDVLTTGATLSECARVLKNAGARSVWGAVAAKK